MTKQEKTQKKTLISRWEYVRSCSAAEASHQHPPHVAVTQKPVFFSDTATAEDALKLSRFGLSLCQSGSLYSQKETADPHPLSLACCHGN